VGRRSAYVRELQTGHLYQYALVMALGIFGLLTWQLWPFFSGMLR
jgi:NADH-quinone oxidoreductase subunit L